MAKYLTEIKMLESFSGKRNAVITLIIPKDNDLIKLLEPIKRRVSAIKHTNKRGQIMRILNVIKEKNKDVRKFCQETVICCGLDIKNTPFYYKLTLPKNQSVEFEYYYDYTFNSERIKELFFENIIIKISENEEIKKLQELEKEILSCSNLIVFENKLNDMLECKMIKEVYWISNEKINTNLIEQAINAKCKIIKFNLDNDHNLDFAKKYGNLFGLLRYIY